MTAHHDKIKEHQCSVCGYSTARLDSIGRHLKSNHHSKRVRDVTKYIMDFNPPMERLPIENETIPGRPKN